MTARKEKKKTNMTKITAEVRHETQSVDNFRGADITAHVRVAPVLQSHRDDL